MKADRGAEVFDMLPLRGVGPVVPVPESAVDQFAGLSCARPQSGFCGESVCSADAAEQLSWSVATFRGELGADAFPPASAFRRRMFALSRSSCSSRSPFYENRARPLPAFLYYCLPFEAPSSYCDRRPRELARACPCGCVASVAVACLLLRAMSGGEKRKKTCPRQRKSAQCTKGRSRSWSCLVTRVTWIYNFKHRSWVVARR